jgi:predicted permease
MNPRLLFRPLARRPTYAGLVIVVLALGVGANSAVFTVVNAIFLRPRPIENPERVVVISNAPAVGGGLIDLIKRVDLLELARLLPVEGIAGQVSSGGLMADFQSRMVFDSAGRYEETLGVTPEYFAVLGLALAGRSFEAIDDMPGAAPVAIISRRLWETAFGSDHDVIGSTVRTSHGPVQIVGVAPPGFRGARLGEQVDVWIPRALIPRMGSQSHVTLSAEVQRTFSEATPLIGIARLRAGVSPLQVEEELQRLRAGSRFVVRPLASVYAPVNGPTQIIREQAVLRIVTVMSTLVLLAACATLAAIILMEHERRRHEFAVRLAIGCRQRQLMCEMVAPLMLLAIAGSGSALLIAHWCMSGLSALSLPGGVNLGRLNLELDWRVIALTALCSTAVMAVAGVLPVMKYTRPIHAASLTTTDTAKGAPGSLTFRRTLLAIHVAATIVVLVVASLFTRTLVHGFGRGAGFEIDRTVFLRVQPSIGEFLDPGDVGNRTVSDARRRAAFERLLSELERLPGVRGVAVGPAPVRPGQAEPSKPVSIDNGVSVIQLQLGTVAADPGYGTVIGVPMLAGRPLVDQDAGTRRVLVTASFAALVWPKESPLGKRFSLRSVSHEVVGVLADFAQGSLRQLPQTAIVSIRPRDDFHQAATSIAIGTAVDASILLNDVQKTARRILPNAASLDAHTGRNLVAKDLGRERIGAWFFAGFSLVTIALALISVFGVAAYVLESRRRELGVRMALGASSGRVVARVILTVWVPVAIGTAAGVLVALGSVHLLESFLLGVGPRDVLSFAGSAFVTLVAAATSGLIAARKIWRVSPLEALRVE